MKKPVIIMIKITFLLLIMLVLTYCSINLPKINNGSYNIWYKHQHKLLNLNQYQIDGLLTYTSNQKKIYARFVWQKIKNNHYYLLLNNLLGSAEIEINIRPDIIELIDNKRQHYVFGNNNTVLNKVIGMTIPFSNLNQWIVGLPGKGTSYKLNDQYLLKEINYVQNDKIWKVIYENYDRRIDPYMPLNIKLIEGNKVIKLKIYKWIFK